MRPYLISVLCLFIFITAKCQPGWIDYTEQYNIEIVDKRGQTISFLKDSDYSIIIDQIEYRSPNIPNHEFRAATPNTHDFEHQIRINDFALTIPQSPYRRMLPIQVIHKKDTMHLLPIMNRSYHLTFMNGHFYVPAWSFKPHKHKEFNQFSNYNQTNFQITKEAFDELKNGQNRLAENEVLHQYQNTHYEISIDITPTEIINTAEPYRRPYWENGLIETNDPNVFFGMMTYHLDANNCYSSKQFFSRLNKRTNQLEHWMPFNHRRSFATYDLHYDPYNQVIYLTLAHKRHPDLSKTDCFNTYEKEEIMVYHSRDFGQTWQKDEFVHSIVENYKLRELQFIDDTHAIGYTRKEIPLTDHNYTIQQGSYYLFKNFKIIDSLATPNDLHYNSNYNRYGHKQKKDTVLLGPWTYENFRSDTDYYQPIGKKINGEWSFDLLERRDFYEDPLQERNQRSFEKTIEKEYQNFTMIISPIKTMDDQNSNSAYQGKKVELISKRKKTLLSLTEEINSAPYEVLENGKEIYLYNERQVYFSFNGGLEWLIYPLPFKDYQKRNSLLEISQNGVISYFTFRAVEGSKEFVKVSYRFQNCK